MKAPPPLDKLALGLRLAYTRLCIQESHMVEIVQARDMNTVLMSHLQDTTLYTSNTEIIGFCIHQS